MSSTIQGDLRLNASRIMQILILIPGLITVVALFFWSPAKVFRNVTLPVLLLFPSYFFWKVALLPPLHFDDTALLPIGIAIVYTSASRWRFTIMDVWVAIFGISTCLSDRLSGHNTLSTFELFDFVCRGLIPYMAGRMLVEYDGARVATLRRIVILMFAGTLVAIYEFFAKANPYAVLFQPIFKDEIFPFVTQIRSGFGRLAGQFSDAEIAGLMLCFGIIASLWLARFQNWGPRFRSAGWLPVRKSAIVVGVLLTGLLMTQSRGPELGLAFGLPVALIGRSRRVMRATILVGLMFVVGGALGYVGLQRYAATRAPTSDEEQTAVYRALLITNYLPMAEHDGAFGYGPNFPRIGQKVSITGVQDSIDNQYLFVALTQGYVGFFSFLLISFGTVYNLIWAARNNPERDDRAFAFTLLGIFVAGLVTLATVYLGFQSYSFFFLMVGWAQAVKVRRPQAQASFDQVYT